MDGIKKKPIDIIECRYKSHLFSYFNKFSLNERKNVKYIVIDLWRPYKDLATVYFPNATIIADRFHYARYATEAVDKIRKRIQKKLPTKERKYFKHSRKLLLSRYDNLNEKQRKELEYMLINYSEDLRIAYREKEELLDIIHGLYGNKSIEKINEWVNRNYKSEISELRAETWQTSHGEILFFFSVVNHILQHL